MESEGGVEQELSGTGQAAETFPGEGEVFSAPEQGTLPGASTETHVSGVYAPAEMPAPTIDEAAALQNVRAAISDEIERASSFPPLTDDIHEAVREAERFEEASAPVSIHEK